MTTYQFHVFLSFIWIIIFFCFLIFNYLITKKIRITFSMIQAINELRNCISPMDIFRKYLNDIIEYNIDSMTVYFVEATSPTVIRKFGDNGFIINCRNNREAEIINTLINCNIPVNDVISTYNSYIVSTSIY